MPLSLWLTITIILILATFAYGGVLAAPWVPLPIREVDRMLALAQPQPGEVLCDLGCGDGRVLIRAVQRYRLRARGYEVALLPYLVAWSRIWSLGLWRSAGLSYRNFFHSSLSEFTIVTAFLTPRAMAKLGPKLRRELSPGARVVSYAFAIPEWRPAAVDKPSVRHMAIYLYRIPLAGSGVGRRGEDKTKRNTPENKLWPSLV